MILCWVTLRLSHSVMKPTKRFRGNEWPSRVLRAFLSGGKATKKATEMDLAASQALYQRLCFWGNTRGWTAVPSQRDSEWEGLELPLKPSCSAELWICEWAMYCGEDIAKRGGGGSRLLYRQTETYCSSAKWELNASLTSVKCSA